MKVPLVVIVGPTAVGKSAVAIKVAQRLDGEIVSADSMQVYKYLDIGTAKIMPEEQDGVAHHLLSIIEPGKPFSVAEYKELAERAISDIHGRGRLPMLVGGTGLYVKAVVDGLELPGPGADPEFRRKLQDLAREQGNQHVHDLLKEVDPQTAARLHVNDLRRVIRALEVYYTTGIPMSSQQRGWDVPNPKYALAMVGLTINRAKLYQRINARVDKMLDEGLVDEVRNLFDRGYLQGFTSSQALGYKEIVEYLEGKCTLEEAVATLKQSTRRYAKRQLTWFRRDPRITWVKVDEYKDLSEVTDRVCDIISARLGLGTDSL